MATDVQTLYARYRLELPDGGAPEGRRVAVHACCAPCSGAIIECLLHFGMQPLVIFSNANIFPQAEYAKRKAELVRFLAAQQVPMIDDDWNHDAWLSAVAGLEQVPERGERCAVCFAWRLQRAARIARQQGIDLLTTTLASSRWKRLDQVNAAGVAACEAVGGITFWQANWRRGGLQERRNEILREQVFYNQLYCGCEFSQPPGSVS